MLWLLVELDEAIVELGIAPQAGYLVLPTELASVSYTHLDVYKRQLISCVFFPITNLPFSLYPVKRLGHYCNLPDCAYLRD